MRKWRWRWKHTDIAAGYGDTRTGACDGDGVAIDVTYVHVGDVVGRGKAGFDFGALGVVVLADGDAAT